MFHMEVDPHHIETLVTDGFQGETHFTVVKLPKTPPEVRERPEVEMDLYCMRVGDSREDAVKKARAEFEGYGFSAGRFYPEWVSGVFMPEEGAIDINPDTVKGFNYWVAEGLISQTYENSAHIYTRREPTRRIYGSEGRLDEDFIMEGIQNHPSSRSVDELICSKERFLLKLKPKNVSQRDIFQMARGDYNGEEAAFGTYGLRGGWCVLFSDHDEDEGYVLLMEEIYSKKDRDMGIPLPQVGVVCRGGGINSDVRDKQHNEYLYDGSFKDLFYDLKRAGIEFEDGIL